MDYQYLIILISVIAILSVSTFYVIPYLKSKTIITDENMVDAAHVINIAETLVKLINVDSKLLNETTIIIESCKQALSYVSDIMNVTDLEQKRKITYDAVVETLTKLGISITETNKSLIKTGISLALVTRSDTQK